MMYGAYASTSIYALFTPHPGIIFRHYVYFFLAINHVCLILGISCYGIGLTRQLHQRGHAVQLSPGMFSGSVSGMVTAVIILVTVVELVGCVNDLMYAVDCENRYFQYGISSITVLAAIKIILEWMPSMVLLYVFRPRVQSPIASESSGSVPLMMSQASR